MPIYEYQCPQCGADIEMMQKIGADAPDCKSCGETMKKRISAPAFQFKGDGWYVTDYARKDKEKKDGKKETSSSSSETKNSESKSSGSKSETKSDSKSAKKD